MAGSMDIDDDVSFADDDSYSYQPPARRLYDGRERFNVPNTNSSRSNRSSGAAFCRLLSLQNLDLSNNQLTGELPDCWWDMLALQFMDLSNNSFSGEIPAAPPGHNCTLQSLHLSGNGFTGHFPSVVNGCSDLATIDISNNRFFGPIPPWIGHGGLPSLKILSLNSNKFIGEIPLELSRLSNLQLLVLANNSLTGVIPKELGNLISMKHPKIVSTPQSLDGSNYQDRIDNI
jgi:Leucine-rich repeat (LRR) protein